MLKSEWRNWISVKKLIWMVCVCFLMSLTTSDAQNSSGRDFPPNTKRGILNMSRYPDVFMDGKIKPTTPITRFYNVDNIIETPASLNGKSIIVNYLENEWGELQTVWILTQEEIKQKLPKAEVWKPQPYQPKN